ncbi:MAG: PD40 domain-containing protein [Phycisphaerae bacterium]|nr:PD40 domain-containing protein [Phycisphaerae bacterium]
MKATKNTLILACVVVAACTTSNVQADFTFGTPEKFGAAVSGGDDIDCFSADGLEMYFDSVRGGGQGNCDLWVMRRLSKDEPWGPAENLGPAVNSEDNELLASISADGLTLYFSSDRPYGDDSAYDVFVTTRPTRDAPWGPAAKMGSGISDSSCPDFGVWISPDNLELYVNSWNRAGGYGRYDIFVARRERAEHAWGALVNLGSVVNTSTMEALQCLSPDGLLLLFSQGFGTTGTRAGNIGLSDLWMARRASPTAPWQAPVNLGSAVNGLTNDCLPRMSADGRTLYFTSQRSGSWDVWQTTITPNCDLNRDGQVDDTDLLVMAEHWGQSDSRCDIGPFPWGNGIVDAQDQIVLLEAIEGPGFVMAPPPHAGEVSRDTVLSWTSPTFAANHDVYFGTSMEDISNASRDNPLGVLVGQGQTTTQYDPSGLLEFGRTYYWRIDSIGADPDATLYRGAVLDFTTEACACPVTNVIATASSSLPDAKPENTINASGLDRNDGHSMNSKDMWVSTAGAGQSPWIRYEFDSVRVLHEMWVWNYNLQFESALGFGFKDVAIEHSLDGTTWTSLGDVQFAQATSTNGYAHNTTVDLGGVMAKYVRLTARNNWSTAGKPQYGLSEVRFYCIPVRPRDPAPPDGQGNVRTDTTLTWRPGRQAALHQISFGTDPQAVADGTAIIGSLDEAVFDPGPLDLGTIYYWKIDEVNEAATTAVWEGDIWKFSTREYLTVDDFESYANDEGSRIYQSWIDGLATSTSGSVVGYIDPPFAEQIVTHSVAQSMPLAYNNADSPFYSQAERTFLPAQDWTVHGADTLALYFRGNPLDFLERPDGSIQLSGGGVDIWDTSDQFRFACKPLRGDGSMTVKIHSLFASHSWAKAGVMIRGSLDPKSAYAFMFPTPDGRRAFQTRNTFGASAVSVHSNVGIVTLPVWLKLERKGHDLTGYYSLDGVKWIVNQPDNANTGSNGANPATIGMAPDVYIGLAVTSHNILMPTIAEFSDVSSTGEITGPWQTEAIGVEQPSNDPAPVYVAVEDDAGHAKTLIHPDPAASQTIEWRQWLVPLNEFAEAGVNMAAVRKMRIGVGHFDNPVAGGTGMIYVDDIGFGHPLSSQ